MAKIQGNKKACLITPGHISSNPRLVKEAIALSRAGIHVHIIFTQYVIYLIDHDQKILDANPEWTYRRLNWSGDSYLSKTLRIISGLLRRFIPDNNTRINRNFAWQLKKAKSYPADIYIAHNPGALPVAVIAAKKNKAKCGFDAEDFHRNERTDDVNNKDALLKKAIEDANIYQLDYMVAASPQIAEQYEKLYNRQVQSILNVFPKTRLNAIVNNAQQPLQLFWFSQTIGIGRGLETIIEAINLCGVTIDLHLLGKIDEVYKQQLLTLNNSYKQKSSSILFHMPVPGDELFGIAALFDIGFATEPGFCFNNKIVLSNKLFTYIQSGLAVIASKTISQGKFFDQYPEIGKLYADADDLAAILTFYHTNREMLYETKKTSYAIGQTKLNWEIESEKLINVVQQTLASS